jgi:hypothetical protein
LNDGAAVSICVRLLELILRQSWISFEQKRLDIALPEEVNNLLMR